MYMGVSPRKSENEEGGWEDAAGVHMSIEL